MNQHPVSTLTPLPRPASTHMISPDQQLFVEPGAHRDAHPSPHPSSRPDDDSAWSTVTAGPELSSRGHRPWTAPSCFHAQLSLQGEPKGATKGRESAEVCTLSSFQEGPGGTSGSSKVDTGNSELFCSRSASEPLGFKTGIGKWQGRWRWK